MRKYFFMGLGCATGLFIFFLVLIGISYYLTKNMYRVENDIEDRQHIQYFDVTTKKGTFTLHTDMPKDSVMLLLGKPDKTNVMTLGGDVHEDYEFKKSEYDYVRIEFRNGLLENAHDF
jgi:hypothetical protein